MKKKIFITLLVIVLIVLSAVIARYVLRMGQADQTDEIGSYYESSGEVRYSPGSKYNYSGGGEDSIMPGCTHRYELDAKITEGGVTFSIFYYDKPNKKTGDLIRTEHITETGVYTYPLDDLLEGSYMFKIDEDDENTIAEVKFKFCREKLE